MAELPETDVEHVRRRPAMYIGQTDFFGVIQYFVTAVNFFLNRNAKQIRVTLDGSEIEVASEIEIEDELSRSAGASCFEQFRHDWAHGGYDGPLINGLSECLVVTTAAQSSVKRIVFRSGERVQDSSNADVPSDLEGSSLRFRPDWSIFTCDEVSPYNFVSFFRRLSYLHPSVCFHLHAEGETMDFSSPGGIRSLFDVVATPYQVLHRPIHIEHSDDTIRVEAVWAYHSWSNDLGFSFINNGRAAEGGTHELGRELAFESLSKKLDAPRDFSGNRLNGIVYVMSIYYAGAVWYGCVKEKIKNPELEALVSSILVDNSLRWVNSHPDVAAQIPHLRRFNFPDIWFHK